MIPMADSLNHSDVNVTNELCTKSLHLKADETSNYFSRAKFMNNYEEIFDESEL